jgi:N-acetylneuraminic acid mutarotase
MYCAAGFLNGLPTDLTYTYDPGSDTWTPKANMVGPRYATRGVYAANVNKFYVFGGLDENFVVTATTQIYDVASDTWSTGTDMPDPVGRYFPGVVYDDASGKIYVIGGFDGATFTEQTNNWIYDPVTDTWDTSTAAPIPVAVGGAGTTLDPVDEKIFVMGTWNGAAGSTMNQVYDIASNSWGTGADIPAPYYEPATAYVSGGVYLMGGGNPDFAAGDSTRALPGLKGLKNKQASNTSSSWITRLAQRFGLARKDANAPLTSYTDVRRYDPATDTWSTTPSLNEARSFTAGTAIGNNAAIVVGGFDGTIPADTDTAEKSICGATTPSPTPTATATPTGSPTCPPVITQSTSQEIVSNNSAACNDGVETVENHYWRAFNMNTFTGGVAYNINAVEFGIELAQSGTGTGQPLTVNLYANHGSPFPGGDWQSNMIATTGQLNIPDQQLTVFVQSLSATVAAGTLELVMEVTTPDDTGTSDLFFVGSNPDPETGTSYISAPACGITDPTPVSDIGFPGMHIVFNVDGTCGASPTPTATATSPTPTATATATPTPTATAVPRSTPTPRPRGTPVPRP